MCWLAAARSRDGREERSIRGTCCVDLMSHVVVADWQCLTEAGTWKVGHRGPPLNHEICGHTVLNGLLAHFWPFRNENRPYRCMCTWRVWSIIAYTTTRYNFFPCIKSARSENDFFLLAVTVEDSRVTALMPCMCNNQIIVTSRQCKAKIYAPFKGKSARLTPKQWFLSDWWSVTQFKPPTGKLGTSKLPQSSKGIFLKL